MAQPLYSDELYIRAYDNAGELVYDFWKAGCTPDDIRDAIETHIENSEFDKD